MNVEYEVGLDDVMALVAHHNQSSPSDRRNSVLMIGVVVVFVAIAVVPALASHWEVYTNNLGSILIYLGAVAVLAALLYNTFSPAARLKQVRNTLTKAYREGKGRGVIGRHTLSVTPESLLDKTEMGEKMIQWGEVEKVSATPTYAFIYTGETSAVIVPHRAFADEAAFEEFTRTAEEYRKQAA